MEDASASSSTHVATQPPLKQTRIESGLSVSQQCVNHLMVNFLVDYVQWFSLVEQPSFRKLIEEISGGKKVMCRKTLMQHIDREFAVMRDSVISSSPCLLMWTLSAQQQTFGQQFLWSHMSLDWQRHAGEIFCSIGMYTSQRSTHQAEYRIQNKVKSTVTDNGSNFIKAFREFGVREDESDYCSDEVRFSDVLQEDGDGEQFFHPQHQLCAAHSLNLFATNGIHKVASNGPLRKLYRSAMAKSSSICNKTHSVRLATGKRTEESSAEQNRGVKFISKLRMTTSKTKTESWLRWTGRRGCRHALPSRTRYPADQLLLAWGSWTQNADEREEVFNNR